MEGPLKTVCKSMNSEAVSCINCGRSQQGHQSKWDGTSRRGFAVFQILLHLVSSLQQNLIHLFSVMISCDPIFDEELFWTAMHCAVPPIPPSSPHFAKGKLVKLTWRGREYFIKDDLTLTNSDVYLLIPKIKCHSICHQTTKNSCTRIFLTNIVFLNSLIWMEDHTKNFEKNWFLSLL